ncbi:MAG: ATP-binding protein [Bryobacteraceae bacterium]|jgi:DNA replication protein DnaC
MAGSESGLSINLDSALNLPFSEWTTVFPNPRLCKALLDRVTDRAHIIETGTESFRFRRTMERRKKKP